MKIAVFDAGVGSFMFAHKVRVKYPKTSVVYLADRKNFPYGSKDTQTLVPIIAQTIDYLKHQQNCNLVIMASNAPTIMCYDNLPDTKNVIGVYPPFQQASSLSKTKNVGVIGVNSLMQSQQFKQLKSKKEQEFGVNITGIDASPLIDGIIENGLFCRNPNIAEKIIKEFMDSVLNKNPKIDVFTLSSTHLPWINHGEYAYLSKLYKDKYFLDPSDSIIDNLDVKHENNQENGNLLCIATEDKDYTAQDLQSIFLAMGHCVEIKKIEI